MKLLLRPFFSGIVYFVLAYLYLFSSSIVVVVTFSGGFSASQRSSSLGALGRRRNFCVQSQSEEYLKRNYANNDPEYNTVIRSLTSQRRYLCFSSLSLPSYYYSHHFVSIELLCHCHCHCPASLDRQTIMCQCLIFYRHYLLRDVYDDMTLDGVKPERDTFQSLIVGTMKGSRLQDAFFFHHEMKSMGLVPDVCFFPLSLSLTLFIFHSLIIYTSLAANFSGLFV